MGLERHGVLQTPSTQPNDKFGQILFPIRPTKGSNEKRQANRKDVVFRTTPDLTSRCMPGKN